MQIVVYGIPNCDTVKRARAWLDGEGLAHRFHDFRKDGVPGAELVRWQAELGWEPLLNRRGTTWRQLDASTQQAVTGPASAATLMRAQPAAIRRPVVDWGDTLTVGFDVVAWKAASKR